MMMWRDEAEQKGKGAIKMEICHEGDDIVTNSQTEREFFNNNLRCGEISNDYLPEHKHDKGCGSRNWRVVQPHTWPPWARILICLDCGRVTEVILPDVKLAFYEKYKKAELALSLGDFVAKLEVADDDVER